MQYPRKEIKCTLFIILVPIPRLFSRNVPSETLYKIVPLVVLFRICSKIYIINTTFVAAAAGRM